MEFRIVVLVSGEGTNLQAIINSSKNNLLPLNICGVISDKECNALVRANNNGINTYNISYKNKTQEDFDLEVGDVIEKLNVHLVILAGYMRVITNKLIERFDNIINIHPALPGKYPGINSIERAYNDFLNNKTKKTGVMVHKVIEKVDAGQVIDYVEIDINGDDTLESLTKRVKQVEKPLLLNSIMKVLMSKKKDTNREIISGKVRDRFDIDYNLITFYISDRLSSYDSHICNIDGKGRLLNLINKWWMNRTQHIISNHLLHVENNYMICKKCDVIPLEMIIRGYITGNTRTSLWTNYNNGVRNYCGLDLPEGLVKNQKLSYPLITPTTKGIKDELISREQILDRNIVSEKELDYIYEKTMELYEYGNYMLSKCNLILVDTKYEFGRDKDGKIILIDEIHTCDSSRIWKNDTYSEKFKNSDEPDKLDKDCIRDYIKNNNIDITQEFEIPLELKNRVFNSYREYYETISNNKFEERVVQQVGYLGKENIDNRLIKNYFDNKHKNMVVILSGSATDEWFIDKLRKLFYKNNILVREHVCSAHKQTKRVLDILDKYNKMDRNIIFITIAGRSNALSGVVACNTNYVVLGCPPLKDKSDYNVNIHSTLQMPSNTPVLTVLDVSNAVLCCKRIFDSYN